MADEEANDISLPVIEKKIYYYHPDTGVLTGSGFADPSPLDSPDEETGEPVWLIPNNATVIEPPQPMDGNIRIFRNGAWGYIKPNAPDDISEEPHGPSIDDVAAERDVRLTADIVYDFGEDDPQNRGVQYLGMSPEDMKGWDVVTKLSTAAILGGHPEAPIGIRTNSGKITVTAAEWQAILIYAGQVQQPFYQASFDLQDLWPNIPDDYRDDKYWPQTLADHVQQEDLPGDAENPVQAEWIPPSEEEP